MRKTLFVVAWAALAWAIWPLPWWRFVLAMVALATIAVLALLALDNLLTEMDKEI